MTHALPRSADWDKQLNAAARDPCWSHREVLHWDTRWWVKDTEQSRLVETQRRRMTPARSRCVAQIRLLISQRSFAVKTLISFYGEENPMIAKPPPREADALTACHPETLLKMKVHFFKVQTTLHPKYQQLSRSKHSCSCFAKNHMI